MCVDNSKMLSQMITRLRLPLTVLVIFVHTDVAAFDDKSNILLSYCYNYIADIVSFVASLAVPSFFVISGYLFFRNIEVLSSSIIISKFRSRFHSLVVPFMFWNLIVLVWTLFIDFYKHRDTLTTSFFLDNYNLYNIFVSSKDSGTPIYMIMWYVRDLIALTLLSPLFYYAIKYFKVFFVAFVMFLFVYDGGYVSWLGYLSIAFFSLGAYVGIKKVNVIAIFSNKCIMASYSIVLFIGLMLYPLQLLPVECVRILKVLSVVYIFYVAYIFVKRGTKICQMASSASFFIYCTHILQPANKITIHAFSTFALSNTIGMIPYIGGILAYFLSPFCTYALCLALYVLLLRLFPKFVGVISGSR